jgi:hypothetical protein
MKSENGRSKKDSCRFSILSGEIERLQASQAAKSAVKAAKATQAAKSAVKATQATKAAAKAVATASAPVRGAGAVAIALRTTAANDIFHLLIA